MANEDRATVILSTCTFTRAESIDSGDTIVLRFQSADGRNAAVLIPREAAEEMRRSLTVELDKPSTSGRGR